MRLVFAVTALALAVWAQSPNQIEVASVKPSRDTMADSNVDSTHGRLTATNITLVELIRLAYDVKDFQIEHAPKWVETERFDIAVKSAAPASNKLDDLKALLRELLAGRFQLTTHRETRQAPVYLLLAATDGPKLTPHDDAGPRTRGGCGRLVGRRVTADALASILSRQIDREVINRTGLSGEYDFQLDFTPDSGPCRGAADSDPTGRPSIYTAVHQQLGLRLQSAKGPVQFLVVDRVEKPTEN